MWVTSMLIVPHSKTEREQARTASLQLLRRAISKNDAVPLGPVLAARGLGHYRGYAELLRELERLASKGYRLETIGKSVEGEPLFALHLGDTPIDSITRSTVVLSLVHPTEWIGAEVALRLLDRMLGERLGDRGIVAIPIVNPDGMKRVERNLRAGRRRFVRHNARGVDLNRNFDARWGRLGLVQRVLGGLFYPGPRAQSEPEVEALAHHLARCRIQRAVSLHSFGGAVLYPSASTTRRILDEAEHATWAERIARAIDPKRPYAALPCARWARGVTAGGLELDWLHDRHGALSLLVECSRVRLGRRPLRLIDPFAWFNPVALERNAEAIASALVPFALGLDP